MPRPKKESVTLNIKIDVEVSKMLENHSIEAGQTKVTTNFNHPYIFGFKTTLKSIKC